MRHARLALLLIASFGLSACGRYADFTLPAPPAGPPIHFQWDVRPQPVLNRGATGEWDSVDALNPSVVRAGGQLINLYSGFQRFSAKRGNHRSATPGNIDKPILLSNFHSFKE